MSRDIVLEVCALEVFTLEEAAAYLRISPRALQDRADIPRCDIAAPGASRPMWRYRKLDLDRFLALRVVNPLPDPAPSLKAAS